MRFGHGQEIARPLMGLTGDFVGLTRLFGATVVDAKKPVLERGAAADEELRRAVFLGARSVACA